MLVLLCYVGESVFQSGVSVDIGKHRTKMHFHMQNLIKTGRSHRVQQDCTECQGNILPGNVQNLKFCYYFYYRVPATCIQYFVLRDCWLFDCIVYV